MKRRIPYFDIFLILFISIIISVSLLSYKRINNLISSSEWVNRSDAIVFKLEKVFSLIKDAETAQRGFLLTRDSSFLEPYYIAIPKIPALMRELDSLTRTDPVQHEKIKSLQKILILKTLHIKSLIVSPEWKANLLPVLRKGKILMDEIRKTISELEVNEQKLLAKRTEIRDNYISITPASSLALILFTLLVVILSFIKIRKDKADISKSNEELIRVKTYLQAILDSSSDIIMTFDEKLYYTSINNAGETYLNHSREELIGKNPFEMYPQARNTERHFLMLKALEGETNQIDSIGTVVNSEKKIQTTFIPLVVDGKIKGVLNIAKDITSLEKANETIRRTNVLLEEKNTELEEANTGLMSFNYIASHDLKEPLRKIQTFAKLLVDLESQKLSESGKYYFDRMISSAIRMQSLIEALLNFSKTHVNNIDFEPTDLNAVMDDLKKEFEEPLAALKGTLEYDHLPVIMAVPLLINQLFANLISNSIKYSKKTEAPEIKISYEKVSQVTVQNKLIRKEFWKISVKDNGIGFSQQYADKIFELFQRLHSGSKDYDGTGIGLTICKKLVQNHKGFIYAESAVGEGSTFIIFLPVVV